MPFPSTEQHGDRSSMPSWLASAPMFGPRILCGAMEYGVPAAWHLELAPCLDGVDVHVSRVQRERDGSPPRRAARDAGLVIDGLHRDRRRAIRVSPQVPRSTRPCASPKPSHRRSLPARRLDDASRMISSRLVRDASTSRHAPHEVVRLGPARGEDDIARVRPCERRYRRARPPRARAAARPCTPLEVRPATRGGPHRLERRPDRGRRGRHPVEVTRSAGLAISA